MLTFLAVVHVFITVGLVLFVLLQDPKGGAMGVFGGGSAQNTFFGSTGATNFLTTVTRWLAILFAISCLGLTYLTSRRSGSVMDTFVPSASQPKSESSAPIEPAAPTEPAPTPPTPPTPPTQNNNSTK